MNNIHCGKEDKWKSTLYEVFMDQYMYICEVNNTRPTIRTYRR